jgi:hypothetical protein
LAEPGGELGFQRLFGVDYSAGWWLKPTGVGLPVCGFAEQVPGLGGAVDVVLFAA